MKKVMKVRVVFDDTTAINVNSVIKKVLTMVSFEDVPDVVCRTVPVSIRIQCAEAESSPF